VAWFASLFRFFTEDRHGRICIALIVLYIAAVPAISRIGLRIHAPAVPASTADAEPAK
jgi:hypothetical protein